MCAVVDRLERGPECVTNRCPALFKSAFCLRFVMSCFRIRSLVCKPYTALGTWGQKKLGFLSAMQWDFRSIVALGHLFNQIRHHQIQVCPSPKCVHYFNWSSYLNSLVRRKQKHFKLNGTRILMHARLVLINLGLTVTTPAFVVPDFQQDRRKVHLNKHSGHCFEAVDWILLWLTSDWTKFNYHLSCSHVRTPVIHRNRIF